MAISSQVVPKYAPHSFPVKRQSAFQWDYKSATVRATGLGDRQNHTENRKLCGGQVRIREGVAKVCVQSYHLRAECKTRERSKETILEKGKCERCVCVTVCG